MSSTPSSHSERAARACEAWIHRISESKRLWRVDVVFSDVSPIASRVETGGSGTTPAIRLQRLFVILPDFPEKPSKITTLFKISDTSMKIYDIIKPALATQPWQCRGSGVLHTRRTTHNRILRMPTYSIAEIEIKYYTFFQSNSYLNLS